MAIPCKQFRVNDRLHYAGQRIKHDAHADHHEHGCEGAAKRRARRYVTEAHGRHRLDRDVKTVKYRPAFDEVKYEGSERDRTEDRHQDNADASPTGEKETRKGC